MAAIRERESAEYRKLRDELLEAEAALVEQRERVAELRRALPHGTPVEIDYAFREGPADLARNAESDFRETRLSELFGGKQELLVQHLMFAPGADAGCPMCSMWADGLDAIAHHLGDRVSLALIARTELTSLRAWGRRRGWRQLRLLSSFDSTFNADFGVELAPDRQLPAFSVFRRDKGGDVLHFYTTEGSLAEAHHRAMDLYTPVWNLFDMLPGGRGSWFPKQHYGG